MRTFSIAVCLTLAAPSVGQDIAPIKVGYICLINDGIGIQLRLADAQSVSCHLEVSATRARLIGGATSPGVEGARGFPFGTRAETRVLTTLQRWLDQEFTKQEQGEYLAMPRVPAPRTEAESELYQRVFALRTLHLYRQVSRPKISKVFAGKGTVSLSLQLTLGSGPPQILLWRRFDKEKFARLYFATSAKPVAIDGRIEKKLLLGIANWLAARLELAGPHALWSTDPADAPADAKLVLDAYRGYLDATSPRLRSVGTVMDGRPGGSKLLEFTDARNRVIRLRFDFARRSKNPGRLYEGKTLVELRGKREGELLAMMRRAAKLRRRWHGTKTQDSARETLEQQLEAYVETFHAGK